MYTTKLEAAPSRYRQAKRSSSARVGHVSYGFFGLSGFYLVQPGLEPLAHPPEHAGEVRVVEAPSLHRVVPVKFFRSRPRRSPASGPRSCPGVCLHGVEELLELCHVGLGNLRLHQVREARVADHVARVARDHEAAGVPLVRGQGQLRREALRLHQRLVVDHDELALVRPAVPAAAARRCRRPRCCWTLQLAPAHPVLRQEEIVREVGGVGHGERVGRKELRRGGRARACYVAAHHAARRHSAARGREGAAQALAVQRANRRRPDDRQRGAKLAAVAAPEAVSVPVDTLPTVVKFPALAVLLMVSVLPVIPVAEHSKPTLAAPVMLSELPDTAPVDDSVALATVPVAVSAAQETAPERPSSWPGCQVVGAHDVPGVHRQGLGCSRPRRSFGCPTW